MEFLRLDRVPQKKKLPEIFPRPSFLDPQITEKVRSIIADVECRGDQALIEYTRRFDGVDLTEIGIAVTKAEIASAAERISPDLKKSIDIASERIKAFHAKELPSSWNMEDEGLLMGERVRPLRAAGCYVPGGNAAYPSSALMTVLPAKVAGVETVVIATPPSKTGAVNDAVLYAASTAGCDRIFRLGGVQAIAAMAIGTETVPAVDKIVGPGNIYVAAAKKELFGRVGIDSLAGPSEVIIIAQAPAAPQKIAADLIAQAEHGSGATGFLFTPEKELAEHVTACCEALAQQINVSEWRRRVKIVLVADLDVAFETTNLLAPEHLQIMLENPSSYLDRIENAGTILLGEDTPAALTDYAAGPNHVLPTGGAAAFQSSLSVIDFMKRSAVVQSNGNALKRLSDVVINIAEAEGLKAHAEAVRVRLNNNETEKGRMGERAK